MSRRHIVVDGVEYPVVEQLPDAERRLVAVRLPDDRERVAVWRLVRWEWADARIDAWYRTL